MYGGVYMFKGKASEDLEEDFSTEYKPKALKKLTFFLVICYIMAFSHMYIIVLCSNLLHLMDAQCPSSPSPVVLFHLVLPSTYARTPSIFAFHTSYHTLLYPPTPLDTKSLHTLFYFLVMCVYEYIYGYIYS